MHSLLPIGRNKKYILLPIEFRYKSANTKTGREGGTNMKRIAVGIIGLIVCLSVVSIGSAQAYGSGERDVTSAQDPRIMPFALKHHF
jgi:hypothetical protein